MIEESLRTTEGLAKTTTSYLPNNLPLTRTDPLGNTTTFEYEFSQELAKKARDPRGVVTYTLLNPYDHPIQTKMFDRMGAPIFDRRVYYDKASRPVRFEDLILEKDERVVTEQAYFQGNLVRLTLAKDTPEESSSIYEYNKSAQKISESKPSGVQLLFHYDAKGRLLEQRSSDDSISYRFTYDSSDRLIEAEDLLTKASVKRHYNVFSELEKEELHDLVLETSYTNFGMPLQTTLPDTSAITYSYQNGMLSSITRNDYEAKISRGLNYKITA